MVRLATSATASAASVLVAATSAVVTLFRPFDIKELSPFSGFSEAANRSYRRGRPLRSRCCSLRCFAQVTTMYRPRCRAAAAAAAASSQV